MTYNYPTRLSGTFFISITSPFTNLFKSIADVTSYQTQFSTLSPIDEVPTRLPSSSFTLSTLRHSFSPCPQKYPVFIHCAFLPVHAPSLAHNTLRVSALQLWSCRKNRCVHRLLVPSLTAGYWLPLRRKCRRSYRLVEHRHRSRSELCRSLLVWWSIHQQCQRGCRRSRLEVPQPATAYCDRPRPALVAAAHYLRSWDWWELSYLFLIWFEYFLLCGWPSPFFSRLLNPLLTCKVHKLDAGKERKIFKRKNLFLFFSLSCCSFCICLLSMGPLQNNLHVLAVALFCSFCACREEKYLSTHRSTYVPHLILIHSPFSRTSECTPCFPAGEILAAHTWIHDAGMP